MAKMTLYKIRHKVTGLYRMAGGGIPGRWNKTGKAWPSLGHVKLHLNMLRYDAKHPLPAECKNWEVVVLEIEESEAKKLEVAELWAPDAERPGRKRTLNRLDVVLSVVGHRKNFNPSIDTAKKGSVL